MEPAPVADDPGATASGGWPVAAKAGIAGSTLRVAAPNGACCRSERRVRFDTVVSFFLPWITKRTIAISLFWCFP
jgi:hypothetical protein